jgi:hypothetical protein
MAHAHATPGRLEVWAILADGLDPYGNLGTTALIAERAQRSDVQATA